MPQVTNERHLSPPARRFYISARDIERSLPDNEDDDAERAFEIWEAAVVLVDERYGHDDGRADLIKLVNHMLRSAFWCPDLDFED